MLVGTHAGMHGKCKPELVCTDSSTVRAEATGCMAA